MEYAMKQLAFGEHKEVSKELGGSGPIAAAALHPRGNSIVQGAHCSLLLL